MLKDKINQNYKEAFKGKKELEVSVFRMLLTAIKNKEIEKRGKLSKTEKQEDLEKLSELTDEEIIAVISSEAKKRQDAITDYRKGGRNDLAEKEAQEIEILKQFLPEEMSEDEVRIKIKEIISEIKPAGPQDFGRVMGRVMAELKGKASGDAISRIVKEEIS